MPSILIPIRCSAACVKGKGHIDAQWSGSWTPADWNWYTIPFQVVSGNTAPLSIPGTWAYRPASKGPYLLPPEPVVYENSKLTKYATAKWVKDGDHHLLIYVRDEATGGLKELWEYYQPWVTRNDKNADHAVAGASWRKFDLRNGETPPPGVPSTDAAGMMILPLVVRYDEVARGSINHALRFCVNNTDISPTFKWPARIAAGAWNRETGMPYGTRLRIKVLVVECQRGCGPGHRHPGADHRRGAAPLRLYSGRRLGRHFHPAFRRCRQTLGSEIACTPECHSGLGPGSRRDPSYSWKSRGRPTWKSVKSGSWTMTVLPR